MTDNIHTAPISVKNFTLSRGRCFAEGLFLFAFTLGMAYACYFGIQYEYADGTWKDRLYILLSGLLALGGALASKQALRDMLRPTFIVYRLDEHGLTGFYPDNTDNGVWFIAWPDIERIYVAANPVVLVPTLFRTQYLWLRVRENSVQFRPARRPYRFKFDRTTMLLTEANLVVGGRKAVERILRQYAHRHGGKAVIA